MTRSLSEHGLIAAYFAPLAAEGGLRLLDDAAFMVPRSGCDLVMTVDALVSGGHFLPDENPRDIARKALAVNISDLAAKGADPRGFLLTLGLTDDWREDWLSAFAAGLGEAAQEWRCPLYGGDTVRALGPLFLSITVLGEVPAGRMVKRGGAKIGDVVCVSGTIGDGVMGLHLALGEKPGWAKSLSEEERLYLLGRHRRPQPRLPLVPVVREYASAAMDVSDGFIGDLEKLLLTSGVSAEIDLDRVPLSSAGQTAAQQDVGCFENMVTGGDDYEIICTIPPEKLAEATEAAKSAGVLLHPVGVIVVEGGAPRYLRAGHEMHFARGSFSHF